MSEQNPHKKARKRRTLSEKNKKTQLLKKESFLKVFRETGFIKSACEKTGIDRGTVYAWRDDPEFAQKFDSAATNVVAIAEEEAKRRAINGVNRDVYHDGDVVGEKTEYSDYLLALILKARHPAYKNSTDIVAGSDQPIQIIINHLPAKQNADADNPEK